MYQIADVIDEISKTKLYNDIIKNQINIKNKNNNLIIKTNINDIFIFLKIIGTCFKFNQKI